MTSSRFKRREQRSRVHCSRTKNGFVKRRSWMGQRRDEVLKAAIDLLDEVGLDGITMRLLAGRLGVRASALYRHYPSKQALLDTMVAHLVTPPAGTKPPTGTWDEQ